MSLRKYVYATGIVVICFVLVVQAASQPTDAIIVNNADEIREESVSVTQGLLDSVAGVAKRVLLENANEVEHIPLPALAGALAKRLSSVADRVLVEVANETRHEVMPLLPEGLESRLGAVLDRILIETANANR